MTGRQPLKTADAPVYALFAAIFWLPAMYVAVVFFAIPHLDGMECGSGGPCTVGAVSALRDLWWAGFAVLAAVCWPGVLRPALAVHILSAVAAFNAVRRAVAYMPVSAGILMEKRQHA